MEPYKTTSSESNFGKQKKKTRDNILQIVLERYNDQYSRIT